MAATPSLEVTAQLDAPTKRVRWQVPGMIERPAVGTSCCASTVEAIIAQELSMLPGVVDLIVDAPVGGLSVTYQPAITGEAELAAALEEIGYPVTDRWIEVSQV